MTTTYTSINPANGEVFARHQTMTNGEYHQAIERCHQAFLQWKSQSLQDRASIIAAIGQAISDNKDALADLMTREMGKLRKQSEQELDLCAGICAYTAENGPERLADEERELPQGGRGIITYQPIGLVYGIQPWNFPAYQVVRYAIANLMAGNGVLLKHASNVLATAKKLVEVFEAAGLPEHLFTLLVIDHDQSDHVIENERVRGVTLTGSPTAGRHIARVAGGQLKKTVLELGSNDAYVVLSDADLELAVKTCVQSRMYNNGEVCVAAKRFIVVDSLYESFREKLLERMTQIETGDPMDSSTRLGPIARDDLRDTLHKQVQESVKNGAVLECGGEIPDGPGFFYPPTVLTNVLPGQPAYGGELFGPVASLIHAKDDDDAMRLANDSPFGLGGGIFSEDEDKALALARTEFDTGMVFINGFGLAKPNMPFGGVKDSGYGREHGGFGMREFVNIKAIALPKK